MLVIPDLSLADPGFQSRAPRIQRQPHVVPRVLSSANSSDA